MSSLQAGTVGVVFTVAVLQNGVAMDLTSFSDITLVLKAPNGVKASYTASVVGDPADGVVSYTTTTARDLFTPGAWRGQVRLDGEDVPTSVFEFTVLPNL